MFSTLRMRFLRPFLLILLSLAGAYTAHSQGISLQDQRAIEELFKGVDPSKYRLQFSRTVGTKKVEMQHLEQVRKNVNPAEAAGYVVLIVEGNDVVYILAIGHKELESVIGKEKVARLNKIMAKYQKR